MCRPVSSFRYDSCLFNHHNGHSSPRPVVQGFSDCMICIERLGCSDSPLLVGCTAAHSRQQQHVGHGRAAAADAVEAGAGRGRMAGGTTRSPPPPRAVAPAAAQLIGNQTLGLRAGACVAAAHLFAQLLRQARHLATHFGTRTEEVCTVSSQWDWSSNTTAPHWSQLHLTDNRHLALPPVENQLTATVAVQLAADAHSQALGLVLRLLTVYADLHAVRVVCFDAENFEEFANDTGVRW